MKLIKQPRHKRRKLFPSVFHHLFHLGDIFQDGASLNKFQVKVGSESMSERAKTEKRIKIFPFKLNFIILHHIKMTI